MNKTPSWRLIIFLKLSTHDRESYLFFSLKKKVVLTFFFYFRKEKEKKKKLFCFLFESAKQQFDYCKTRKRVNFFFTVKKEKKKDPSVVDELI